MPEKIVPHTHCKVCGKAIPQGKTYCSKACNERDLAEQKKTKRTMMLYFGIFFVLLIAMVLMSYFYSGT